VWPRWKRLALRHGWHPHERCACGEPEPVIVGGDGFYAPPLFCARCRRVAAVESPPSAGPGESDGSGSV
jgi:hypothetical protein